MTDSGRPSPSEEHVEALDDEAPPEIPDLSIEVELPSGDGPSSDPMEVEPEPIPEPAQLSSAFRRLSPPPKPRRRERSITAPQTPSSRSFPPALNDESVALALKAPPIPSLQPLSAPPVTPPMDLSRTQPSFAPPQSPQVEAPVAPAPILPPDAPAVASAEPDRRSNGVALHDLPPDSVADLPVTSATPAVLAMRIITVGEPAGPRMPLPPAEARNRSSSPELVVHEERTVAHPEALAPTPLVTPITGIDVAFELNDDDVAPDSEDGRLAAAQAAATAAREATIDAPVPGKQPAPPPPPRRSMASAPSRDELGIPPSRARSELPAARDELASAAKQRREEPPPAARVADETGRIKSARRAWWEELFGEDFVRAIARLSDTQVRREVDFIEDSLGVAAGGVVLDLGCGAGYHAVELASRGYGVVGYDLSLFQLALAADVAQESGQRINFLQGDMREMAFEEMFDGIYCWNTTFGYFDEEKNFAVAQRVFRALRPGGMFLLDVINRDFVAAHQPSQVWYEGDSCVCMDDMSLDFITSRLKVKRSLILDDGRTREATYSVRLYALHELGKMLHDVGFRITEASGHQSTPGVFFGQCSPRILILAQRP